MGPRDSFKTWRDAKRLRLPYSAMKKICWVDETVGDRRISVLDCRAFCLRQTVWTTDRKTAERFACSRSDDGKQLIGRVPLESVSFNADLVYPFRGGIEDGAWFLAIQMEDKWDIFLYSESLYFTRSWTRDLIIKVDFERVEDGLRFAHVQYARSALNDDDYCLQVAEYLFKSHCFDMIVPHPLPRFMERNAADIVSYSFHVFGRRAWFATFDSTLRIYGENRYGFPPDDTAIVHQGNPS